MNEKPLILIVNDDGYEARGLEAMVEIAKPFGEVVVVTPDRPQSAMSHAITMNMPLRVNLYKTLDGVDYWRANGTPSDCMKLGELAVLKGRSISLVLSGINHGSNASVNLVYSGTMAAAIEASMSNIPAIGLSLCDYRADADFTACIHYGKQIVQQVLEHGIPPRIALNINVPVASIEEIRGIKITRQADGIWRQEMEEHVDPAGRKYYWLKGAFEILDQEEDTCEWALQHHYISVQPVHIDMTAHPIMNTLKFLEQ